MVEQIGQNIVLILKVAIFICLATKAQL